MKSAASCKLRGAAARDEPVEDIAVKAVGKLGPSFELSVNPDSRLGRVASPYEQVRVKMEQTLRYVGIDVAVSRLDVFVLPEGEARAFGRDEEGIAALSVFLRDLAPQITVLEATGGYEAPAAMALAEAGLAVAVVNPAQVRNFAKGVGKRAKTDAIDAQILALFAQTVKPEARIIGDACAVAFKALMARRRDLIIMTTAERNRLGQARDKGVIKDIKAHLAFLERRLKSLDGDIDGAVRASPVWRAKEDLMQTVAGVGPRVSRTLLAELPELGTLGRREIASLAGLAPMNRDSGTWRGKRYVQGGRMPARNALYMAALVAVKWNPTFKTQYERLLKAGKAKKSALVAVARKLLVALNAMIRDETVWKEGLAHA